MARANMAPRLAARATEPSTGGEQKPEFGDPYLTWLDEEKWQGDTRELREGRYLHQQAALREAFEGSDYWNEVATKLSEWAECYWKESGAPLFQATPTLPRLASKPCSAHTGTP